MSSTSKSGIETLVEQEQIITHITRRKYYGNQQISTISQTLDDGQRYLAEMLYL